MPLLTKFLLLSFLSIDLLCSEGSSSWQHTSMTDAHRNVRSAGGRVLRGLYHSGNQVQADREGRSTGPPRGTIAFEGGRVYVTERLNIEIGNSNQSTSGAIWSQGASTWDQVLIAESFLVHSG